MERGADAKATSTGPAKRSRYDFSNLIPSSERSRDELDLDPEFLAQAIEDVLSGAPAAITPEQMDAAIIAVQQQTEEKSREKAQAAEQVGKAFREAMQRGHDWTVFTPRFDVSAGAPWPDDASQTQWRHGVSAPHPEGWSIRAWPWEEKSRLAGRGLPDLSMLSAEDALARMIGSGEKP